MVEITSEDDKGRKLEELVKTAIKTQEAPQIPSIK